MLLLSYFSKKISVNFIKSFAFNFSLIKFIPSELVTNLASSLSSYALLSKPKLNTFKFFLSCIVLEIATIKDGSGDGKTIILESAVNGINSTYYDKVLYTQRFQYTLPESIPVDHTQWLPTQIKVYKIPEKNGRNY